MAGESDPPRCVFHFLLASTQLIPLHRKAFFLYISPFIDPTSPSRLPFLSLLLAFLSRHSAKAYHALPTPLLGKLTAVGLLSASPVAVALAVKCLAIFLVTLPVIIGDALPGIMAVYGRVVSWETVGESEETAIPPADAGSQGASAVHLSANVLIFDRRPANQRRRL